MPSTPTSDPNAYPTEKHKTIRNHPLLIRHDAQTSIEQTKIVNDEEDVELKSRKTSVLRVERLLSIVFAVPFEPAFTIRLTQEAIRTRQTVRRVDRIAPALRVLEFLSRCVRVHEYEISRHVVRQHYFVMHSAKLLVVRVISGRQSTAFGTVSVDVRCAICG